MKRRKFDEIVERYKSGEISPEDEKMLDDWADLHFQQHSNQPVFSEENQEKDIRRRIWENVRQEVEKSTGNREPWWADTRFLTGIAASLIGLLVFVYFLTSHLDRRPTEETGATLSGAETRNISGTPQRITLPDGSTVVLEKGASLITDENFGQKSRTVYLTGEAFFEVRPDAHLPFFVYTGDLVTEVLGTSFHIKSEGEKKTIEVSVVTGKVSVYADDEGDHKKRNGVIATSNQKVIYNAQLKTLRHDLTDTPRILAPEEHKPDFHFRESTIEEVLQLMREVYKIEIIVVNPLLNECIFTGDLNELDLYQQLDFICEVIGARYEIRGAAVFVNGESCHGL